MSVTVANWIAGFLGLYLVLGLLFAVAFHLKGLRRIDPATEGGTIGFRLIILPGGALAETQDVDRIAATEYDPTAYQPQLFLAPSFARMLTDVEHWIERGRWRNA